MKNLFNNPKNVLNQSSGATAAEIPAGRGLTRRQVALGAAWSVPVIALAVATPLAAASQPIDSPTAYITGTLTATGTSATARSARYSGGNLTYNSAGTPGLNSGNITITIYNTKTASWTMTTDIAAAYAAAGWTLVSASPGSTTFAHAPISSNEVISMPSIDWVAPTGSAKPALGIQVSSDNDDVSGIGLSLA